METSLWQIGDRELVADTVAAEVELRRLYFKQLQRLSELDTRGVATKLGYSNTAALLLHSLRITRGEARNRIAQAEELFTRATPTGAVIEASLPQTAAALERGEIGAGHVEVILKTFQGLRDLLPEKLVVAEAEMLDQASVDDPNALARFGTRVREMVDPDGTPPKDTEPERPSRLLRWRTRRDGTMDFSGWIDPENAGRFTAMLAPAEKYNGAGDSRGHAERAGDTFCQILTYAATCPDLPTGNGVKTEVALTVSYETITTAKDDTVLDLGDAYMTARDVRKMLCDAHVLPAVMGGDSQPLDVAVPAYVVPAH